MYDIAYRKTSRWHDKEISLSDLLQSSTYVPPCMQGTQDLTTEHLDLRRFKARDAHNLFAWSSDSQNLRFFQGNQLLNEEEARTVIGSWRVQYSNDDFLLWCIQDAETGQAVGKISATVDDALSSAEVEYSVAPWSRGRGYAAEALSCVIEHLHTVVGVHRVEAKIHYENTASMKTAERAGMQWEGLLRDALVDRHGIFYDVAVYAHVK